MCISNLHTPGDRHSFPLHSPSNYSGSKQDVTSEPPNAK